ncbi:MAG: helix-hairpin-helix domain-containing protein [Nitriliruptorales bacterium]
MIVLSFVLVIVAAVTLVIGLFQTDTGLEWIWASIGSCVAAMVFLGIGVLQRRGARPRVASDESYGPTPSTGFSRSPEGTGVTPATGGLGVSPVTEDMGFSRPPSGMRASPQPGATGVSPATGDAVGVTTPSEQAGETSEGLKVLPGRSEREAPEESSEDESVPDFLADRPVVVPKRTAKSPLGTDLQRTAAESTAPARTEEMPTATPPAAGPSPEDATSGAASSQASTSTPSPTGAKKTSARAGERTRAKKSAAKATKKATSKKAAMAPAAGRGTARRAPAKEATDATSVPGQPGRAESVKSSKRPARLTREDAARAELAKIRGLGPAKQEALLREFGSIEAIRAASIEQLTSIRGIGETTAREILAQAHR